MRKKNTRLLIEKKRLIGKNQQLGRRLTDISKQKHKVAKHVQSMKQEFRTTIKSQQQYISTMQFQQQHMHEQLLSYQAPSKRAKRQSAREIAQSEMEIAQSKLKVLFVIFLCINILMQIPSIS